MASSVKTPRRAHQFTDEEVIELRQLFRRPGNRLMTKTVAKRKKITQKSVSDMLSGRTYRHLDFAIPDLPRASTRRSWPRRTVEKFRRMYAKDKTMSSEKLAEMFGGSEQCMRRALIGITYKDVPGAIKKMHPAGAREGASISLQEHQIAKRRFTPEVALFIRLAYRPHTVSFSKIGKAFGVNQSQIADIVNHVTYKDAPEVPQCKEAMQTPKRFTDEEVALARGWAMRGTKTILQTAAYFGAPRSVVRNMVIGKSYAHLPNAVPVSIWTLRRRKHAPLKMRSIHFLDHDERVDLVSIRAQAA
jgi:hypothetical protein